MNYIITKTTFTPFGNISININKTYSSDEEVQRYISRDIENIASNAIDDGDTIVYQDNDEIYVDRTTSSLCKDVYDFYHIIFDWVSEN